MRVNPERLAVAVVLKMRQAMAPLVARITALEGKAALVPRDGRDGAPGPVGPVGPSGERGEKGDPGQSVSADELESAIHAAQAPLLAQIASLTTRMAGVETKALARGPSVTCGIGPPTLSGKSGDSYIDIESGDIYECR
jgi:hypothetical protein